MGYMYAHSLITTCRQPLRCNWDEPTFLFSQWKDTLHSSFGISCL